MGQSAYFSPQQTDEMQEKNKDESGIYRNDYFVGRRSFGGDEIINQTLFIHRTYEAIPKGSRFLWENNEIFIKGEKGKKIGNFIEINHANGWTYYIKLKNKSAGYYQEINMHHSTYLPTNFEESDWNMLGSDTIKHIQTHPKKSHYEGYLSHLHV